MGAARRSIGNSFVVTTMEDPVNVIAQYAPNNNPTSSQIHDVWQDGDLYMRTKTTEEGATWSDWHRIIGESGDETLYSFNISKKKTSTNKYTAPTDCYYQTWQDGPVTVNQTYPYLWMCVVKKTWNDATQQYDTSNPEYARITGEESTDYFIEGALNTFKVAAGASSTAVGCTYNFYKKSAVNSDREAVTCYYAVYKRTGSTFSLLTMNTGYTNHGQANNVVVNATVPYKDGNTTYDAVVIFIFASEYYNTSPEAQSYLAKKEIPLMKDGDNAFIVDLDNEMVSIALDEDGETTSAVEFHPLVRAFYGTQNVIGGCTVTVASSVPDLTATYNSTTHCVDVSINSGTHVEGTTTITVTVVHSTYGTRTTTFIISGIKAGDNAVLQEILPSLNEISFARQDNGTLSPASRSLSLSFKKTEGGEITIQTLSDAGLTVRWSDSAMPSSAVSGNNWGNGTSTGISWDNITMKIANSVSASNIYIAAFKLVGANTYVLVDRETIPIIKDGKHGANAPYVELSRSTILYDATNGGASSSSQDFAITYSLKVNGVALTIASVSDISISLPTNVTIKSDTKTTSGVTFNIASGVSPSGVITITMTGTDANGISYTASSSITVGANKQGNQGDSAVMYYVNTDIDNVVIPSDVDTITLSSVPKAYFRKITGNTEASQSMYWGYCWRDGTSYGTMTTGQPSDNTNLPQTYSSEHDALVVFVRMSSAPTSTNFDAKKEIVIQKRGNTGGPGKDAKYIHIKGTGFNNIQSALCEVYNGTSLDSRTVTSRGLTIFKINRSTLAITLVGNYDVYGDSVASGETACQHFAQDLDAITSDYFVCIVSYDAVRWTSEMIQTLAEFGSLGVNDTTADRVPFAFIGQKGLAQGQAMQVQGGSGTTDPPAEIVVYVSNGVMATSKEPTFGKLGGRFYYNAGEFTYSSSISFYVTPNEAPYFLYNGEYWVFEPNVTSGTAIYTTADMGYPSSTNSNWHLMFFNKQKFLMSDVMFAQYAHLGSFVFNGDWMISTNGKIDGSAYNNNANIGGQIYCAGTTAQFSVKGYTLFNNTNPLGETQVISERGTGSAISLAYNETRHTIYYGYFKKDKTYKFTCTGKRNSSSYAVYVRIRRSSNDEVSSPTMYPSTSDYTSDWGVFRVVADGYYYIEMYQDSTGSGHGGETSDWKLTEISFRPNLALDGMTGKTYQMEAYVNGTIISEYEYMGNKIIVDAEHGGFKMIGPVTVNDDDGTPNGDSRQTLFEVGFFTDPDALTRLASLYIRDGHDILESEVDPEYGFRTRKRVSSGSTQDRQIASLSKDGVGLYDSEYWESASVNGTADLSINIYGITFRLNNTTYHKSWAQLLG